MVGPPGPERGRPFDLGPGLLHRDPGHSTDDLPDKGRGVVGQDGKNNDIERRQPAIGVSHRQQPRGRGLQIATGECAYVRYESRAV